MSVFTAVIFAWALLVMISGACGIYLLYREREDKMFWIADALAIVLSAAILGYILYTGGLI